MILAEALCLSTWENQVLLMEKQPLQLIWLKAKKEVCCTSQQLKWEKASPLAPPNLRELAQVDTKLFRKQSFLEYCAKGGTHLRSHSLLKWRR